ncbi:M20/M25/M40 family metallo-hydrolase, partial [Alicyclobacillaceae bacterium I2511]
MEPMLRAATSVSTVTQLLQEFAAYGATPEGGVTRLVYTEVEQQARLRLQELCTATGLKVRVDAAGNLIARRNGTVAQAPVVAFGSHLDTVVQAGAYDGVLGVMAGLAVMQRLNEAGLRTRHPLELIAFTGEESARFGVATLGSKAMTGRLNLQSLLELRDVDGISLPEALVSQGRTLAGLAQAKRDKGDFKAYLELHIEQGPVLEGLG